LAHPLVIFVFSVPDHAHLNRPPGFRQYGPCPLCSQRSRCPPFLKLMESGKAFSPPSFLSFSTAGLRLDFSSSAAPLLFYMDPFFLDYRLFFFFWFFFLAPHFGPRAGLMVGARLLLFPFGTVLLQSPPYSYLFFFSLEKSVLTPFPTQHLWPYQTVPFPQPMACGPFHKPFFFLQSLTNNSFFWCPVPGRRPQFTHGERSVFFFSMRRS